MLLAGHVFKMTDDLKDHLLLDGRIGCNVIGSVVRVIEKDSLGNKLMPGAETSSEVEIVYL